MRLIRIITFFIFLTLVFGSCISPRHLGRTAVPGRFLDNQAISDTHVGIAIYDADRREYLYTHNSDKFFVPASNTKLPTLYAGLKYLDKGIPGIRYMELNDTIFLQATGDPAFLLHDFQDQPVLDFLKASDKPLVFIVPRWDTEPLGYGWPWNFYLNYYMPERSPFPVYGNVVIWAQKDMTTVDENVRISYVSSFPKHPWPVDIKIAGSDKFEVRRPPTSNVYSVYPGPEWERELFVPFATNDMQAALELLKDTLNKDIIMGPALALRPDLPDRFRTIYSRAADSLFRPMMLHSDNFFAEQILIMVSNEIFGVMDETMLIEYLLENDLRGMPDNSRWVDGSGLSRYNLFSPGSFVWLLEKMKDEFGFERIIRLLPTGGEGTLEDLYLNEQGRIYAKTGTLGGNSVALSGFLFTGRNRTLIFSVLVNNHNKDSGEVRTAIEDFLKEIIYRY